MSRQRRVFAVLTAQSWRGVARALGMIGAPIALQAYASAAMAQLVHVPAPPAHYVGNDFGRSLAGLPDADGDGRGDFVAGAPGGSELPPQMQQRGRAFVFSGAATSFLRAIRPPFDRGVNDQSFGTYVADLNDVDGDGLGDVAVSSHFETPPGGPSFAGRVYVFSGATGAMLHELSSPHQSSTNFGLSLASVPDCDGDGRWDVVAGTPEERPGALYIFSGATGEVLRALTSPDPNQRPGSFPSKLAGVEDITGDGLGEVMVSTTQMLEPPYSGLGNVYVYNGATGEVVYTLYSPIQPSMSFGHECVAGVPDVDGDGCPDLAVGSSSEVAPGLPYASGLVHLFSGRTGELIYTLPSPAPVFAGGFGHSVAGVEDRDGDGRGDLFVSAPWEGPSYSGVVHLISGASAAPLRIVSFPLVSGSFGINLSTVPDANGDGLSEVVIGLDAASPATGDLFILYSCAADFDASGVLEASDFFAYLDAFLDQSPGADFDRSGVLDSSDFFAYVVAFFAGCG